MIRPQSRGAAAQRRTLDSAPLSAGARSRLPNEAATGDFMSSTLYFMEMNAL
jgi:hypothetical protein